MNRNILIAVAAVFVIAGVAAAFGLPRVDSEWIRGARCY